MTTSTNGLATRDQLRRVFVELLRVQPAEVDDLAAFVDLGADSLVLLQASRVIRERFGVTVPFRALLDEFPTVAALTEHLRTAQPAPDNPAPDNPLADNPLADKDVRPVAHAVTAPPADLVIGGIIRAQLDLMAAQLDLLETGAPSKPAEPPAPAEAVDTLTSSTPYVPYQPIRPGATDLDETARAHIDTLIRRITTKTARSRAVAQADREYLANERANARFRLLWKEMQYPLVFSHAEGATVHDLDGNRYVDLTMGFGALLFGHTPPVTLDAVRQQLDSGIGLGLSSPASGEAARLVRELTGLERVAFVNSGTDAVTVAVRLARTVTGRSKIAMFAGSYHGGNDQTLVRTSGTASPGALPIAPGLLVAATDEVVVLEYGSKQSLAYLRDHAADFAAVLVEPVQSRRPGLRPREFLVELSRITRAAGTALVLDEVITGFRTHPGGLRSRWGIQADMCTFGKVAGGGVPIGIVAGDRRFLDAVDGGSWQFGDASYPQADTTYVAGTFFRHPLHMPAVVATLQQLHASGPELQERLEQRTTDLVERINKAFAEFGMPVTAVSYSSWFVFEFAPGIRYPDLFFFHLLDAGVYVWEGRICYLSTAHTNEDLDHVVAAVTAAATALSEAGLLGGESPSARPLSAEDGDAPAIELGLTAGQSETWALSAIDPDAIAANQLAISLRLRGELRADVLTAALDEVVGRHEALRTAFAADGRTQLVHPRGRLPFTIEDGTGDPDPAGWIAERAGQPFDTTSAPLVRASLLRLAADDHVLLLSAHHLAMDGASLGLVVSELAAYYTATVGGRSVVPPTPASYVDYVRDRVTSVGDSGRFWLEQHRESPVLDLPTDRPRGAYRTFASGRVRVALGHEVTGRVRELVVATRATPTAVLLAGYVALLRALSGQNRAVVGAFADDRYAGDGRPLVADAVSMVPLAFRTPTGISLPELVIQARAALADGYEHRHFSYRDLIRELGLLSDTSRPPLVATTFNLDEQRTPDFGGLTVEVDGVAPPAVGMDLVWNVVETAGRYSVECDFNAALFDAATIRRWIGYYSDILIDGRCGGATTRPLGASTAADVPEQGTGELIAAALAKTPHKIVVTGEDGSLSGVGLANAAGRIAAALRASGVRPGSLVGLTLRRGTGLVAGLIGVWRAGAAYLPLDPGLPADRLQWMIDDSQVQLVLTDRAWLDRTATWGVPTVCIEDLLADDTAPAVEPPPRDEDRLAYVMYTSGSTGRPKAIAVPDRAVANFVGSMIREPGLAPDDLLLAVTTPSFDISVLELVAPLCAGAQVVVAGDGAVGDGHQLATLIDRHGVTAMQATPATWLALVESGWPGSATLRVLCGGDALPPSLAGRLLERAESVWNLYGPTECTIWSTVHRLDGLAGAVPIGLPIDNTGAYVLDELAEQVPPGVVGELCLGGFGVAWGYPGRPGLTAERFVPDPFAPELFGAVGTRMYRTGDLARQDVHGVLSFLGRHDHQVKVRGFRVELGEIEATLAAHPSVTGCVCALVADRLVAYLVPRPGHTVPAVAELRGFIRRRLPDYMVPATFVPLAEFPLTPNGKVDRGALPTPDASRPGMDNTFVAPANDAERQLAAMWSAVLDVTPVGVHDNFLELGGDSIAAIRVASLARAGGFPLAPQQVLRGATIAELAAESSDAAGDLAPDRPASAALALTAAELDRIAARVTGQRQGDTP